MTKMTGYVFAHKGKQYDPNGSVTVIDAKAHNQEVERAELAQWAEKPARHGAYIVQPPDCGLKVCTWLGTDLGRVIESTSYRNSLTGSRMRSVRIAGNNGATYYGSYGCDWAQFMMLRKCKEFLVE